MQDVFVHDFLIVFKFMFDICNITKLSLNTLDFCKTDLLKKSRKILICVSIKLNSDLGLKNVLRTRFCLIYYRFSHKIYKCFWNFTKKQSWNVWIKYYNTNHRKLSNIFVKHTNYTHKTFILSWYLLGQFNENILKILKYQILL